MLRHLNLRDFLFIEQAEINFGQGFCVLTGETGAGKSILLDALGLSLGGRADTASIRTGAARAEIVAEFEPTESVRTWLAANDLAADDDVVLLRRVLDRDGRGRAYVNGSPVTVGQLRDCGERLLEIHGQHASQALLQPEGQRRLLDGHGQLGAEAAALERLWREWRAAGEALASASAGEREREQALAQIDWQLEAIDALAPGEHEWDQLNEEQTRLAHGARLLETAGSLAEALADGEGAVRDVLDTQLAELRACQRLDARLGEAIEMLDAARIHVDEAASWLARYAARADLDPARLAEVEARVADWFALARRLRVEPDALAAHAADLRNQRDALQRAGDLDALRRRHDEIESAWRRAAEALGSARARAAQTLSGQVDALLPDLGMPSAAFSVALEAVEPGPHGLERVAFLFSGHPDLPARPLARVASGGELSRISLAITVVAARANPVPTLIFDEADAGIGGGVADAIGRLMRRLGADRQILAVTHLPQVAACAHCHLRVVRDQGSARRLDPLDDPSRVEEIARMLGGQKQTSREHARALIDAAAVPVMPAGTPARKTAAATVPSVAPARKNAAPVVSSEAPARTHAAPPRAADAAGDGAGPTARPRRPRRKPAR